MEGHLFCGLAMHLETMEVRRRSGLAKLYVEPVGWPDRAPYDVVRRCCKSAMDMWAGVANVGHVEVSSEREADFVIRPHPIDGPQGVLADCMLPGPPIQVCRCDRAELWTVELGPAVSTNLIDLDRVLRHEFGHFWGIGHDRQGARSLMAPTYSRTIWEPQEWDVQQIQSLYGKPVVQPPDGRRPHYSVTFDANGVEIDRFRRFD